jgi:hypothetical protein
MQHDNIIIDSQELLPEVKDLKKFSSLLSVSSDPKTIKGLKKGYLTGIQYLAPSNISGFNVCKNSGDCAKACLMFGGRAAFDTNIPKARINRTKFFFEHRDCYFALLIKEILALENKAKKLNLIPVIRLNGMSDLTWERIRFKGKTIFELFPHIQFYDYSKYGFNSRINLPSNYHLTYSYSEKTTEEELHTNLANNRNVAVVFNICINDNKRSCRNKCKCPMIKTYKGFQVTDGDQSDLRFLDPDSGVIVGLRAKGEARNDILSDGSLNKFTIKIHRTLTNFDIKQLAA